MDTVVVQAIFGRLTEKKSAIDLIESEIPYVRFVRSDEYGGSDAEGDKRLTGTWHPNMAALEAFFQAARFARVERFQESIVVSPARTDRPQRRTARPSARPRHEWFLSRVETGRKLP